MRQERLYFFQFPAPLPEFVPKSPSENKGKGIARPEDGGKTVTFSEDTKPSAPGATQEKAEEKPASEQKVDGVIGQLEVYQSGAVKMRLANGIVMDVSRMLALCFPSDLIVCPSGLCCDTAFILATRRLPGPSGETFVRTRRGKSAIRRLSRYRHPAGRDGTGRAAITWRTRGRRADQHGHYIALAIRHSCCLGHCKTSNDRYTNILKVLCM